MDSVGLSPLREETRGDIRLLVFDRPPVNAIDLGLLAALDSALDRAADAGLAGLILTGRLGMFSAGLDLPTLLTYDRATIARFWELLHSVLVKLLRFPEPILAAIGGHCPAGGTVLALPADRRLMCEGDYWIGLNEVEVGLAVPPFIVSLFQRVVGYQRAGVLLIEGRLLHPREALTFGLIDEVIPPEHWEESLRRWSEETTRRKGVARTITRRAARADLLALADATEASNLASLTDFWFAPDVQRSLHAFVARLKARGERRG